MAARWAMLLVAALPMLAAFGITGADMPPSTMRLCVTAIVAVFAPLFWPGNAAKPARTAGRIAVWSAAAACLAAVVLRALSPSAQPTSAILASCLMLMAILLVAHAAAAGLQAWWCRGSGDAAAAGEMAGRTVALALALLCSVPLWLGPVCELLQGDHPRLVDTLIGVSPLTHLAMASGNDLLHNQWLYQHSNLAVLPYAYPGLGELAWSYGVAASLLMLAPLALWFQGRRTADTVRTRSTSEKAPS